MPFSRLSHVGHICLFVARAGHVFSTMFGLLFKLVHVYDFVWLRHMKVEYFTLFN